MILGMIFATVLFLGVLVIGIRIIRPTHVGLIETFGKFTRQAEAGFNWVIPVIQRLVYVNITEQMADVPPQQVITKDKLNAEVDAVVYYQVHRAKEATYNVHNHRRQLTSLARTTLRAVIGKMSFEDCNEKRDEINEQVEAVLSKETSTYGVKVLRVEIQRIEAPIDVQAAMNNVVKAEQDKIAAKDAATAVETRADGERRAAVKQAEGVKEAAVLKAQGHAEAIKLVNESANKYFVGNAQELKRFETITASLGKNTKYVLANDLLDKIMSGVNGFKDRIPAAV